MSLEGILGNDTRPGVSVYYGATAPGSVEVLGFEESSRDYAERGLPWGLASWLERHVVFAKSAPPGVGYRYAPDHPFRGLYAGRDAARWFAALCAEALEALHTAGRLTHVPGIGWSWYTVPGDSFSWYRPLVLLTRECERDRTKLTHCVPDLNPCAWCKIHRPWVLTKYKTS